MTAFPRQADVLANVSLYGDPRNRARPGQASAAWEARNLVRVSPPFRMTYAGDPVNGLIIFKFAPGSGVVISASFEFDVPVRFTEDTVRLIMLFYKTGVSESIDFKEIRVREVIDLAAIDALRATL